MFLAEKQIILPSIEPLGELTEILARGYLRKLLSESDRKRSNRLKPLDLSAKESNELDV